MSTTENEFEEKGVDAASQEQAADAGEEPATPGAPEPSHQAVGIGVTDSFDPGDHHGQDEGRDTLTVGQAQRTPGGLGSEQEQRLPAMSQNDASAIDKVAGIVAQTRQDIGSESVDRIAEVLTQRFGQSGVDLPENEVRELAQQIATGDASSPQES